MPILIKRYANRKLYNTKTSRYITLKGIAELIEDGEEVRVVDNETGEDITSIALSQILVDTERTNQAVPGNVLSELIQRGGDALYGALRRRVNEASEGIEDFQKSIRRLVSREGAGEHVRDWIAFGTPDIERVVQGAMERVLKVLDLPTRGDIQALDRKLERVADALERFELPHRETGGDSPRAATPDEKPDEGLSG